MAARKSNASSVPSKRKATKPDGKRITEKPPERKRIDSVPVWVCIGPAGDEVVYLSRGEADAFAETSGELGTRYAVEERIAAISDGKPNQPTDEEIAAKVIRKELQKSRREYNREHNPIADRVREANRAMLDHLHELLFDPLWVCGPDGFVNDEGVKGHRRATDAESLQCSVEDYGKEFTVDLYGDIPAQVIAGLRARIKLHQDAIRRIRAAGKRGELVAVPVSRKAVK